MKAKETWIVVLALKVKTFRFLRRSLFTSVGPTGFEPVTPCL
jgi:hypothetical protein